MKYATKFFIVVGIGIVLIGIVTKQYHFIATGVLIALVNGLIGLHSNKQKID